MEIPFVKCNRDQLGIFRTRKYVIFATPQNIPWNSSSIRVIVKFSRPFPTVLYLEYRSRWRANFPNRNFKRDCIKCRPTTAILKYGWTVIFDHVNYARIIVPLALKLRKGVKRWLLNIPAAFKSPFLFLSFKLLWFPLIPRSPLIQFSKQ